MIPPWSQDGAINFDEQQRRDFRAAHGLSDKFVVMYSGNHSPCHPLDTLLAAAEALRTNSQIVFCFVGGGSEKLKVEEFAQSRNLPNIKSLPYQPLTQLSASLSAADLHVVVMGDPFVGIVHPSKLYNILKVGAPLLYIGPGESHVTDLVSESIEPVDLYGARHGETELVTRHILAAANGDRSRRTYQTEKFSSRVLLPLMIAALEPHAPALIVSTESSVSTT